MNRIFCIAARDFLATVATKGFIIGLLITPAMIAAFTLVGPRLFGARTFKVEGDIAVVDPTGVVLPQLKAALDPQGAAARRTEEFRRALSRAPESVRKMAETSADQAMTNLLGPAPDVGLVEHPPDADLDQVKMWLRDDTEGRRRLAVVVIHRDAVNPAANSSYGAYDLYVPPRLDNRAADYIYQRVREAIVNARIASQGLNPKLIEAIAEVRRPNSITITRGEETQTVGGFNFLLPIAFTMLMFIGLMTGGQGMLTSMIEEKSSRVVEVLLSAVSPMQLMAGKLIAYMAISLLGMGIYILMGLALLSSFSLLGVFDPWLILYLFIFFIIGFLVVGSLMMAVGAAVNELSEAQSLQMPLILILITPWFLWPHISNSPNSMLSIAVSHAPPINTFGMLLRMASTQPPATWEVWLSIAIGIVSVFAALWAAAKIFRIGLLMYGKPPNFATLIRWVRAA